MNAEFGSMWLVGHRGTGSLNLSNGGSASSTKLVLAQIDTGNANVSVSGTGSVLDVGQSFDIGLGGTANVSVTNGGTINASTIHVGSVGGVGFEDNISVVGPGSVLNASDSFSVADATIKVSDGGKIVTRNLNLTREYSAFEIELSALCVADDYVAVDMNEMLITNGTLMLDLVGNYVPTYGTEFNLFDFGFLSGTFDNIFIACSDRVAFDLTDLYVDGTVSVAGVLAADGSLLAGFATTSFGASGIVNGSSEVPEPGCVALLCLGALAVAGIRRRK